MREWMELRGLKPESSDGGIALSAGDYREFNDFPNIMRVIEHVRLGGGERARKLLSVTGEPLDVRKSVHIDSAELSFDDILLKKEKDMI